MTITMKMFNYISKGLKYATPIIGLLTAGYLSFAQTEQHAQDHFHKTKKVALVASQETAREVETVFVNGVLTEVKPAWRKVVEEAELEFPDFPLITFQRDVREVEDCLRQAYSNGANYAIYIAPPKEIDSGLNSQNQKRFYLVLNKLDPEGDQFPDMMGGMITGDPESALRQLQTQEFEIDNVLINNMEDAVDLVMNYAPTGAGFSQRMYYSSNPGGNREVEDFIDAMKPKFRPFKKVKNSGETRETSIQKRAKEFLDYLNCGDVDLVDVAGMMLGRPDYSVYRTANESVSPDKLVMWPDFPKNIEGHEDDIDRNMEDNFALVFDQGKIFVVDNTGQIIGEVGSTNPKVYLLAESTGLNRIHRDSPDAESSTTCMVVNMIKSGGVQIIGFPPGMHDRMLPAGGEPRNYHASPRFYPYLFGSGDNLSVSDAVYMQAIEYCLTSEKVGDFIQNANPNNRPELYRCLANNLSAHDTKLLSMDRRNASFLPLESFSEDLFGQSYYFYGNPSLDIRVSGDKKFVPAFSKSPVSMEKTENGEAYSVSASMNKDGVIDRAPIFLLPHRIENVRNIKTSGNFNFSIGKDFVAFDIAEEISLETFDLRGGNPFDWWTIRPISHRSGESWSLEFVADSE